MVDLPLDPDAVSAADDRFYEAYPEMIDENGDRIPLSAQNDPSNEMHEDWIRFYEEELARNEEGEDDPGGGDDDTDDGDDDSGDLPPPEDEEEFPTTPPNPCEECANTFISLDVMYAKESEDCTGVPYSALLTDQYLQPSTGADPRRWDPIPPGTCLFGEFDFHADGKAAAVPSF